jgi:hypothetical protein
MLASLLRCSASPLYLPDSASIVVAKGKPSVPTTRASPFFTHRRLRRQLLSALLSSLLSLSSLTRYCLNNDHDSFSTH